MIGAILGDIAGSTYEFKGIKGEPKDIWTKDDLFTDDTVLTCATAASLIYYQEGIPAKELQKKYILFIKMNVDTYPNMSWGSRFIQWVTRLPKLSELYKKDFDLDKIKFSDSYGNGCAMKIAPVAYAVNSLEECKRVSKILTQVTHNSEQGIRYAEAVATSTYVALHTKDKQKVIDNILLYCPEIQDIKSYKELKESYSYTELARNTIPQALYCFMVSNSTKDAIKKAVGLGGDADTLAAITGAVAEAFYGYKSEDDFLEHRALVGRYIDWEDPYASSLLVKQLNGFYNKFGIKRLIK